MKQKTKKNTNKTNHKRITKNKKQSNKKQREQIKKAKLNKNGNSTKKQNNRRT